MTHFRPQYRDDESSRLIYLAQASAEASIEEGVRVETPETKKEREEQVSKLEYDPAWVKEKDPRQSDASVVWVKIDEVYGKTPYEKTITEYVDSLMPEGSSTYKQDLIKRSVSQYMDFYEDVEQEFMNESDDIQDAFEEAVDDIVDETGEKLAVLQEAIEGAQEYSKFNEKMPSPERESEVKSHFERYLEALGGRYFNVHLQEGETIPGANIPIFGVLFHLDKNIFHARKYEEMAENFQDQMETWVMTKLDWLLKKGATQQELIDFRKEIAARYSLYSRFDGDRSLISWQEVEALEQASHLPDDEAKLFYLLDLAGNEGNARAIRRLEIVQLINPSAWKKLVRLRAESVIARAQSDLKQDEFIAKVNEARKARGEEPVKPTRRQPSRHKGRGSEFDIAGRSFKKMMGDMSEVGVRETLAFLKPFEDEVLGELKRYETQVEDESLEMQTAKQLDYLMGSHLEAQKETDKALVRFMDASEEERLEILMTPASRDILLRGIRMATRVYPDLYERYFGNIPDDPEKLKRSWNIEKATHHDKAAQLQALIILGHQAEVLVDRYSRHPKLRGLDLNAELEAIEPPEDISVVSLGLGFKRPGKRPIGYKTALERGGFTLQGLGLKGAKILGVLAIASNVAQSYSEAQGEDFIDKMFDTLERSVTNHGVIAGTAVLAGAHLAERNTAFLRYPWLSQHEQKAVFTSIKLDNMRAAVGTKEVNRFLHNDAEWRALDHPKMDAIQIGKLMDRANERVAKGAKPAIFVEDIEQVIPDESIVHSLTTGGRSARMRFLFYKKFFSGSSKPLVSEVKEICTGTGYYAKAPTHKES